MTTLPCTCRPACSSTAARTCSTGKRRRDGHAESARRGQTGDLLDGAGGGVGAVGRRDAVHLGGDRGHAGVRYAELACHRDRVRAVQVDGRGDAVGSQVAESVGQALAIGDRLGSRVPAGRRPRSADPVPMTRAPARRASWTANTPTPPPAPPISSVSDGPGLTTASAAAAVHPAMARVAAMRSSRPSGVWCASPPCRCDRARPRPRSRRRFVEKAPPNTRSPTVELARPRRRPRPRRPRSRSRTRTAGSTRSGRRCLRRRS